MRQKKKFEEEINRAGNSHISQRSPPQEEIPTTNSTSLTESNTDEEDRFNVPQLDSLSTSLASAAPMSMITLTPMADMSQIKVENIGQYKMENLSQFKVEPLSSNELLQDASTMNLNSFTAPGTSPLEGTATALNSQSTFSNWMNYAATPNLFTQYPPQLSFQSYSPYSASAVGGAPYDYSAFSAAPNYYMNASRQDLAKFWMGKSFGDFGQVFSSFNLFLLFQICFVLLLLLNIIVYINCCLNLFSWSKTTVTSNYYVKKFHYSTINLDFKISFYEITVT